MSCITKVLFGSGRVVYSPSAHRKSKTFNMLSMQNSSEIGSFGKNNNNCLAKEITFYHFDEVDKDFEVRWKAYMKYKQLWYKMETHYLIIIIIKI